MENKAIKIGFTYFSSKEYFLENQLDTWLQSLQKWNGTYVIFTADFDTLIPEDVFAKVRNFGLEPMLHFNTELPSARRFNDVALILDLYQKWGTKYVILGDQPNVKKSFSSSRSHKGTLVDDYLEGFMSLANHAVKIGLIPVIAPLAPGGDFWDCSFLELVLEGLKQKRMTDLLDAMVLSSYGFTFSKPLSWGKGGPEYWPGSKPYITPDGQQDQIGFNNFEWLQAVSLRRLGKKLPVIILNAGSPGPKINQAGGLKVDETLRKIVQACHHGDNLTDRATDQPAFNEFVVACSISLEELLGLIADSDSLKALDQIFVQSQSSQSQPKANPVNQKVFDHYLLLPSYTSGVSDVVLNKVRPLIKKFRPTLGFSIEEALHAAKVTVFPDPNIFTAEQINKLRVAGCDVEILPQAGIEIATLLQD
ncbi:MAG: hypothetical protein GX142_02210 [Chloroflexi bacterium]|nr:hypothetical protein [Chloroflexota bacterium]